MFQTAPDLRLEDNEDPNDGPLDNTVHDPINRLQTKDRTQDLNHNKDKNPIQNIDGLGMSDHLQQLVAEEPDNQDINQIEEVLESKNR